MPYMSGTKRRSQRMPRLLKQILFAMRHPLGKTEKLVPYEML